MPNTREKLIDGTGREMRFTGGDVVPAVRSAIANGVTLDNQVSSSSKYLASSEWIPVTERLPERYQNVLTVRADRKIRFDAIGSLDVWYEEVWHTGNPVTHWMPLPEVPKGE